jgi:VWFA-related protein
MISRRQLVVGVLFVPAVAFATLRAGPVVVDRSGATVRMPLAGHLSQEAIFSSRVDTVRLDVSVRQGGRAVRGLVAGDFEIVDSGVRQQVDFVALERTPANVVLALDMSGSVQGSRLTRLREAGARLVEMLAPGDTAAVVAFTALVTIASGFTSDRSRLLSALHEPVAGGDTALFDATHAALVLGESGSGRPLVITFSDGTDTASFLSSELVLDTARRTEPVVYAVTSAQRDQDGFLDDLVRLTGGRRLEVASLDGLSDAFAEILSESRERYLIGYTPTGVPAGGWHDVEVRVRGRRADVRARPGYLAPL